MVGLENRTAVLNGEVWNGIRIEDCKKSTNKAQPQGIVEQKKASEAQKMQAKRAGQ